MTNQQQLINQFKAARAILGISQDRVAFETGIPQRTISELEQGKRDCKISTVMKLANFYGFEVKLVDSCAK